MELTGVKKQIQKIKWAVRIGFDFYGTKVGFKIDDEKAAVRIRRMFPEKSIEIEFGEAADYFLLVTKQNSELNGFYRIENGFPELAYDFEHFDDSCLDGIELKLLFTLAMISPPKMFYFHAGAVSIEGRGILIPGRTFSGKTTLTKEFIKNGADYYSDDCSLIDSGGFLYPYPIKLGVRGEKERQYLSAADLGAVEGVERVSVEFVLLTGYEKGKSWNPRVIDSGQGAFRLLEYLFYPPSINCKPAETLNLAAELAKRAKFVESLRGESIEVVRWLNDYLRGQ